MEKPHHHPSIWRETALTCAGSLAALVLLMVIGNQVPELLMAWVR
ncbi:hypothetical protein [Pseudomonas lalucatii]|nr:hypothetical protein [Pseudomonas lalucatii]